MFPSDGVLACPTICHSVIAPFLPIFPAFSSPLYYIVHSTLSVCLSISFHLITSLSPSLTSPSLPFHAICLSSSPSLHPSTHPYTSLASLSPSPALISLHFSYLFLYFVSPISTLFPFFAFLSLPANNSGPLALFVSGTASRFLSTALFFSLLPFSGLAHQTRKISSNYGDDNGRLIDSRSRRE